MSRAVSRMPAAAASVGDTSQPSMPERITRIRLQPSNPLDTRRKGNIPADIQELGFRSHDEFRDYLNSL